MASSGSANNLSNDSPFFDISDFQRIFGEGKFELPRRWNGIDFIKDLQDLFSEYTASFESLWFSTDNLRTFGSMINHLCDGIIKAITTYLDGKPSGAFDIFYNQVYQKLMKDPLPFYSSISLPASMLQEDKQKLFRMRKVYTNGLYRRKDIFHTPYNKRNNIATTRYSIPGFPSLYLSSSIKLCKEELNCSIETGRYIVSRFGVSRKSFNSLKIIDLGLKPSDFMDDFSTKDTVDRNKKLTPRSIKRERQTLIDQSKIRNPDLIRRYFLWYPVIAACSYIRLSRNDPFSFECILPQLLMQSVMAGRNDGLTIGIRYFSCASVLASDMGFDYVFPTSGNKSPKDENFCDDLGNTFQMTKPLFLSEYTDDRYCTLALSNMNLGFFYEP